MRCGDEQFFVNMLSYSKYTKCLIQFGQFKNSLLLIALNGFNNFENKIKTKFTVLWCSARKHPHLSKHIFAYIRFHLSLSQSEWVGCALASSINRLNGRIFLALYLWCARSPFAFTHSTMQTSFTIVSLLHGLTLSSFSATASPICTATSQFICGASTQ